ncbi:MAG: serine protein kinase RIO [Candidatus Thermoplasmatota archaeon]|nr:serine protein kinase RIO [Candidatus Thermoplasmatota archaeon]
MTRDEDYHAFEREIDGWRKRRKDSDDRKSYDEVFDHQNLMRIYKLFTGGVIDKFDFPISTGKEGNVYRATTKDGELRAVKIFRTSTSTFKDMVKYVHGDPRFGGLISNRKKLILAWAEKEFLNLHAFDRAGVRVPKPYVHKDNIIVMEYIGDGVEPARELRNVRLEDPEAIARKILDYIRLAYQKAKLVHADLSEFNILMLNGEPVVIDVGQAVMLSHSRSGEWLERDVRNVARYFKKYDLAIDAAAELEEIRRE